MGGGRRGYIYKLISMYACNSPEVFQDKMNEMFQVFGILCAYMYGMLIITTYLFQMTIESQLTLVFLSAQFHLNRYSFQFCTQILVRFFPIQWPGFPGFLKRCSYMTVSIQMEISLVVIEISTAKIYFSSNN